MALKIYVLSFCLLLSIPASALAGGFCCQPGTALQDGVVGSIAASAGNLQLRADYTYTRMSKFINGDSQVSLASVLDDPRFLVGGMPAMGGMGKKGMGKKAMSMPMGIVPEVMDMHRVTLSAAYSPLDRLRLTLAVPWVINNMTMFMSMKGAWSRMTMDEVAGLGDVTFAALYRVYQDDEQPTAALSLGAGVKTPTGPATVTGNSMKRLHAHMQPGTGSWDPIFTAAFMKVLSPKFMTDADVTYHIATSNPLGYDFGDTVAVNTALRYSLASFMNVSVGVNYFHAEQADDPDNKYNGQNRHSLVDFVGYTGEDSIWVSPGVQVFPYKGASMDLKFQYPVYYHVPDIEFVSDWRLIAGISYSF